MRQTLRQIVAVLALVAMSMNLVPSTFAATYTDVSAANKLAEASIINDFSANVAGYRLGDNLLRQEAIGVAGKASGIIPDAPVSDYVCQNKFSDISEAWVCRAAELAAKAGITNAANSTFRPKDNLTRYEAMLFAFRGSCTDVESPTMTGVAEQAAAAGIISNAASFNGNAASTRGEFFRYVAASLDENECSSEDDNILCVLDPSFCDEEDPTDPTDPVKAGEVEVSLAKGGLTSGSQIPQTGTIKFAAVDFEAGSEDVTLETVTLSKVALASIPTSTRVWFEKDGKRLSGKAAFSSDGTAVVSFAPAYLVKADSTATLDLYVELSTGTGEDYQFSGTLSASSAEEINGSFVTPALRTTSYTVAPVTIDNSGSGLTTNLTTDFVELGRFTVANNDGSSETRDVKFQTITLRQLGTGDLSDLSDVRLERNGVQVSTEVSSNGKDFIFTVNDTIKDAATATYYIRAKVTSVENNAGDTYNFSLRNTSDMNLVEENTGFRSTVTDSTLGTLNTYTINGADLIFARDTSVELSKSYAKGTNEVILAKGTIKSKTAVTLEDISLAYTSNIGANQNANDAFTTVYLQIGSSVMTWSADDGVEAEFNGLATVDGTAEFKIWAKIKDAATLTSFKFEDLNLDDITTAEYVSNQNDVTSAIGSISAVQVSIDSSALAITRTDGLGDTTIASGSTDVTLNSLALTVSQGNDLVISNPVYTVTSSNATATGYPNNVTATLYVDGVAVSTKNVTSGTVTFDANATVTKAAKSMTVKATFSDAFSTGTFSMKLTGLDITDALTSNTVVLGSVPNSAEFTIGTANGVASSSDLNPKASLLLAGAKDQKILAFRFKAENDDVKLRDLDFDGVDLDSLSNFRILTPSNKFISATSVGATSVVFSNIAPEDSTKMDKTETYYLIADVNTNVDGVDFNVTLDVSASNIKGTNGTLYVIDGSDVASNVHFIVENKAVVSKNTNGSKSLTTSALRFSVTATGEDSVELNTISFNNIFSGYTGAAATVKVYKNSVSAGNLLGTSAAFDAAAGGGAITVTLSANNTVDEGITMNYIVVVDGVAVDALANSSDWTVSATDINFDASVATDVDVADYENLGDLPITETK